MVQGFRCDGAVYPLFVKVVKSVPKVGFGDGGVCIRLQEYWGLRAENKLIIHTSQYAVEMQFRDVAYYLEAYRSLEDCLIKGFHLWVIRGVTAMEFKVN